MKTKLFFLSIVFLALSLTSHAQRSSTFFKEDFLYKQQSFRIEVEKEQMYKFSIISFPALDTTKMTTTFDLINLSNINIFEHKLKIELDKHIDSFYIKLSPISIYTLKSKLQILKDSITNDSSYLVVFEDDWIDLISQVSAKRGCREIFDLPIVKTLSKKNPTIKNFFDQQAKSCKAYEAQRESENDDEIKQLAINLFEKIKFADLVIPSDASLAGELYIRDTIPVTVIFKDKDKNDKNIDYLTNQLGFKALFDKDTTLNRNLEIAAMKFYKQQNYDLSDNGTDKKVSLVGKLVVDSVQIEFEHGMINNIKVVGKMGKETEIFENVFPIPYSTKKSLNDREVTNSFYLKNVLADTKFFIPYGQVFWNDYNLLLNTENYAPKDQVITLYPKKKAKIYKEENREILETKVFTDFIGLGEDEPNGILQLEFAKLVNLSTAVRSKNKSESYWHFFNYIQPSLILSKIEDDDSVLKVNRVPTLDDSIKTVAYDDMLKYRRASFGADLNLIGLGLPGIQSEFELNFGLYYSLISFQDQNVNNIQTITMDTASNGTIINNNSVITQNVSTRLVSDFGPSLIWRINPSDKYQFSINYSLRFFRFYNSDEDPIIPVVSRSKSEAIAVSNKVELEKDLDRELYHTFEFLASATLSDNGSLFFRSRYNFLEKNKRQNFFQLQLGYSFFFFSKNQ